MTGPGYGHGLGVAVRTSMSGPVALRSIGGYGWRGAAGTWYFADPKEDLFGICLAQLLAHRAAGLTIREDFERLVYQALI